jgi:glucuronyl/N-acetylglucosaminyl transferase EXT2
VFLTGKFNIILTKACFLHSKYLSLYSGEDHPNEIRDYVDKHKNCEDVAMSFLVANATKYEQSTSGPIYVEGSVKDTGLFGGISTGSGHMTTRSDCLTELASIYTKHGWGLPLYDVDLTKQGWRKHYPGFWWQNRPSNVFEWPSFGNMLS